MSESKAAGLWEAIVAKVKESELDPPLWRALDAGVPIQLDGASLVVGFAPQHEPEMAFLNAACDQPLLAGVLAQVATRPVTLTAIDGTTPDDWVRYQERERLRREVTHKAEERAPTDSPFAPPTEGGIGGAGSSRYLQELMLDLRHRYVKLPHRTATYVKASFLHEILPELVKAEGELRQLEATSEGFLRAAARLIDRVAEVLGVDSFQVALEFKRYRREHARE